MQRELYLAAGLNHPVLSYDSIESADGPVTTTGDGFHGDALPLDVYLRDTSYELRDRSKPMFASHGGEIRTYDANGADEMEVLTESGDIAPGLPIVSSTTIPFGSEINTYGAIDAHWGASRVYDYYKSLGRDSLDGKGGTIKSLVGVTEDGQPLPNAFWDGKAMVYGTGGQGYKPFAASLDVVGHEMTHGVVEHTANLLGFGQSGALNEGFADYFGNAIENGALGIPTASPASGLMGQDLCTNTTGAACAIRDLNKLRTTKQFDGEVHDDSTIASGAFWDTREILGDTLGDRVMYRVLAQYLTPNSTFLDARHYTVAAARKAGATDGQLDRIRQAFSKRGISPGWERRDLGLDSRVLRARLTLMGPDSIGLSGGRYVLSDNGASGGIPSRILAGYVDGHGPRTVSPNPDRAYLAPSTDGATDVWMVVNPFSLQTRVQTHDVATGRIRTLVTYAFAIPWESSVSGQTVAWVAYAKGKNNVFVRRPDGKVVRMELPQGQMASSVRVLDRQVVYTTATGFLAAQRRGQLRSYDVRNGRTKVLAKVEGAIGRPTITPRYIVFPEDRYQGMRNGIVRVNRDGSHRLVLVGEGSQHAGVLSSVTASRRWVTYDNGFGAPLRQLPIGGGWAARVSCSRGAQLAPQASWDRRVSWIDFTTGSLNLVTREKPRGTCTS